MRSAPERSAHWGLSLIRGPAGPWADFRGNRQYISVGNIAHDDRVTLFFMDYPHQLRLKVYGRADVIDVRDQPEAADTFAVPGYPAPWTAPAYLPGPVAGERRYPGKAGVGRWTL